MADYPTWICFDCGHKRIGKALIEVIAEVEQDGLRVTREQLAEVRFLEAALSPRGES